MSTMSYVADWPWRRVRRLLGATADDLSWIRNYSPSGKLLEMGGILCFYALLKRL